MQSAERNGIAVAVDVDIAVEGIQQEGVGVAVVEDVLVEHAGDGSRLGAAREEEEELQQRCDARQVAVD